MTAVKALKWGTQARNLVTIFGSSILRPDYEKLDATLARNEQQIAILETMIANVEEVFMDRHAVLETCLAFTVFRDDLFLCEFRGAHSQIRAAFCLDGKDIVCGSEDKYHIFTALVRYNVSLSTELVEVFLRLPHFFCVQQ
ncbi:hypothetical protein ANCCAN_14259 [Ancylostoma caninum]|uniref:Uncharacterized protein n=1 Tax=Ancylostoma caninum TaxID=29170 RepID=A0A368G9Z0_ANCCA|nr:hypothetical protein ANCCAN_14259 [Ancylostoma caninum]